MSVKTYSARVENGRNSFIQIINDRFEGLSDLQLDRFNFLMSKMNINDFDEFYRQHEKLLEQTYAYDGRVTKDNHIYHAMSTDYKRSHTDELITELRKFLGVSQKELDEMIRTEKYDSNGKAIEKARFTYQGKIL